jgi:hypothetical protein
MFSGFLGRIGEMLVFNTSPDCRKALYYAKEENKTSIERVKNAESKSQHTSGVLCLIARTGSSGCR